MIMDTSVATELARREAATHGCCCKCCSLRTEIWVCFVIDLTSIVGLLLEIPRWDPVPADLHAADELRGYLAFSIFSACLILFALFTGTQAAWPRRLLVRFMSLKLPFFVIFCMGYYTISPWAAPLARWVCERDFEQIRSVSGGDYDTCVQWFPWIWTFNNVPYIFVYAYTLKACYDWFRCHPSNDNQGIWCSRAGSVREDADYIHVEQGSVCGGV